MIVPTKEDVCRILRIPRDWLDGLEREGRIERAERVDGYDLEAIREMIPNTKMVRVRDIS